MSGTAGDGGHNRTGPKEVWAWFSGVTGSAARWLEERKILLLPVVTVLVLGAAFTTGATVRSVFAGPIQIDLEGQKPPPDEGPGQPASECRLTNRLVWQRISASERPLRVGRQATLSADMLRRDPALENARLEYFFEVRSVLGDISATGWVSSCERLFVPEERGKLTVVVLTRNEDHVIVGCESEKFEVI